MQPNIFLHLVALFLILNSIVPALGQTRRTTSKTTAANSPGKSAPQCSGAWTGMISYTRTQSQSDNKTVERVSGRGKDTREWQMKFDYKGAVSVIESPEKNGQSIGRATINHSFSSVEKTEAVEKNSCDRGKTWREMKGSFVTKTEASANAGGIEANVHVGVNSDGTYSVSVALPPIKGKVTGSTTSSFSNQCTPKEGKNQSLPETETTIDGHSLTSDGTHRINPNDPNRLSGNYSISNLGVTETITWNLQKCGAPLRLIDLQFADMKFPNWNNWKEIVEQTGTIDGNLVKIKARVLNASGETKYADVRFKETYKGDKWDGAKPDAALQDNVVSLRLDAGEEREVEMLWDSSGYAWYDDGRPRLVQRIKAELEESGKKIDELTKNLKVAPKPVVLVHGLWSSWKAWESWQNILTTAHSYDWKAFPVGEKAERGVMNTGSEFLSSDPTNSIFENSQQLGKYIRYAQEDRNAWHVDVVAHSMGGLISRHYIHQFMPQQSQDGRPQIAHLVMLGTPNMGSPCADVMNFAFEMTGKNVEAIRQLRPAVLEEFNRVNLNRKGVKFSVLAGNPLPAMCKTIVANDGVVPVPSAVWKIKDNAISGNVHTELTGTKDFSDFVKPRLAIGPKGNHRPEAPELQNYTGQIGSNELAPMMMNASFKPVAYRASFLPQAVPSNPVLNSLRPDFAKDVPLAPKQIIELEIPIKAGKNFGVTFLANANVSATLVNDKGVVIGKNLANTAAAKNIFREIFYAQAVTGGTWKLKLENTATNECNVLLTAWSMQN
jgi:hypothetical protein